MDPWLIVVLVLVAGVAVLVARRQRTKNARVRRDRAMAEFESRLPALGGVFLEAASRTGKPRGLRWAGCRFEGDPLFAVDRANGDLYALVNVTVSFSAIEGGGMEEVEAVGNLRAATAVFIHRAGDWSTDGRVVFNLNPDEALNHYRDSLSPVESDPS